MKTIDEEVGHDEPGEGPVVNGLTADSSSPFADMPLAVTPFAVTPDGIRHLQLDIEPDDAVECMPLKEGMGEVGKEGGEGEEVEEGTGDEWNGTEEKKGPWDKRCMTVGVLLLLLIVCGAIIAIAMHRFSGPDDLYHLQFASYFGDHMVLQRAPSRAVVWGYGPLADDNRNITLRLDGEKLRRVYSASIKGSGQFLKHANGPPVWRVLLDPVSEPGPFVVTVTLDDQPDGRLQLVDVLFGDVWVCAGQSNMQFPVSMLSNATAELDEAHLYPDIRLFVVSSMKSPFPAYDLQSVQLPWSLPSKTTLDGTRREKTQFRSHFSALCWLYGRQLQRHLAAPIGLMEATFSVGTIDKWASVDVLETCGIASHSTSEIWNSMINPLLYFSLFGVLWYQGESDALVQSYNYNCTFVHMVRDWREKLHEGTLGATDPQLPFGFVQLAPNRAGEQRTYGFTDIRWRQTANFGFTPNAQLENVFMAVAIDLPADNTTANSIHSRYKADVAARLVRGALGVAYGREGVVFAGPLPLSYSVADRQLVLTFNASAIDVRSNTGFEICCALYRNSSCPPSFMKASYAPGRVWLPAPILPPPGALTPLRRPARLALSTAACDLYVVALRYAWRETPCPLRRCAVYGTAAEGGLPMAPYICTQLVDDGEERWLSTGQVNIL